MPTMATTDGRWFDVADATKWDAPDGTLYHIAGRWVLRDELTAMLNTPASIVSHVVALTWLVSRGHDVPAELQPLAEQTRLRSVPVSAALEVSS